MFLTDWLHHALDYALSTVKLVQNREVGWMTLDRKTGKQEGTKSSTSQIAAFVDFYHINMEEYAPASIQAYNSFEDFFIRKHTPSSRPIHNASDPTSAVVVADSRVVVYPTVSQTRALWIKGKNFTITNLIQDSRRAESWDDGAVASFRLSPQDHHRYHSPVRGTVSWAKEIPGEYYQVDPVCLQSDVDVLTLNHRWCICIDPAEFGEVLFVAIGATNVGKVDIHEHIRKGGARIEKGDEIGIFQFGGSSIIVAFEKGRIEFDEDLLSVSRRQGDDECRSWNESGEGNQAGLSGNRLARFHQVQK